MKDPELFSPPRLLLLLFSCCLPFLLKAQSPARPKKKWYISWGYNTEKWMPSTIRVSQNGLNSNFTLLHVKGHDEPDWETGIFNKQLTEPQFNFRLGYLFGKNQSSGIELSLDHTKYTVTENQLSHITGTVNGLRVDKDVVLSWDYFSYKLHNGANHLMLNYVSRMPLVSSRRGAVSLQAMLKAGAGIMLPHAENRIMGQDNNVGPKALDNLMGIGKGWWRYGGYTGGLEGGLHFSAGRYVFLEVSGKLAYANLSDIPVYDGGIARQELWMLEGIISAGLSF